MVWLLGFSPYQKILAAIWRISHDFPTDYTNDYLRIDEDATLKYVRMFAKVVILLLGRYIFRLLMKRIRRDRWHTMNDEVGRAC
jgi:hypothetical protein